MSGNFTPSSDLLAQLAHIGFGMSAVFGAVALHYPFWYGLILIFIIEIFKEFVFDIIVETSATSGGIVGGFIDMSFWFVGGVIASTILYAAALIGV